jgi:hypothetical protein
MACFKLMQFLGSRIIELDFGGGDASMTRNKVCPNSKLRRRKARMSKPRICTRPSSN